MTEHPSLSFENIEVVNHEDHFHAQHDASQSAYNSIFSFIGVVFFSFTSVFSHGPRTLQSLILLTLCGALFTTNTLNWFHTKREEGTTNSPNTRRQKITLSEDGIKIGEQTSIPWHLVHDINKLPAYYNINYTANGRMTSYRISRIAAADHTDEIDRIFRIYLHPPPS